MFLTINEINFVAEKKALSTECVLTVTLAHQPSVPIPRHASSQSLLLLHLRLATFCPKSNALFLESCVRTSPFLEPACTTSDSRVRTLAVSSLSMVSWLLEAQLKWRSYVPPDRCTLTKESHCLLSLISSLSPRALVPLACCTDPKEVANSSYLTVPSCQKTVRAPCRHTYTALVPKLTLPVLIRRMRRWNFG
jgi:hypothetical protein